MFYAESLSYYMVGRLSRVLVSFVLQNAWGSFFGGLSFGSIR